MRMTSRTFFLILILFCASDVFSQLHPRIPLDSIQPRGDQIGTSEYELIESLMLVMPGFGGSTREMLTHQSVKPHMMPARKRGKRGSDLAYAMASCLEYYVNYQNNYKVNLSPDYISLSIAESKSGEETRNAFLFLINNGTVSAAIMPYDAGAITTSVFATPKYKINNYLHIFREQTRDRQKIFEIKKALMRGNPVLTVLTVSPGFNDIDTGGDLEQPTASNSFPHPVVIVSYDEEKKAFEILNTRGREWGNSGYLWMSYSELAGRAINAFILVPSS